MRDTCFMRKSPDTSFMQIDTYICVSWRRQPLFLLSLDGRDENKRDLQPVSLSFSKVALWRNVANSTRREVLESKLLTWSVRTSTSSTGVCRQMHISGRSRNSSRFRAFGRFWPISAITPHFRMVYANYIHIKTCPGIE